MGAGSSKLVHVISCAAATQPRPASGDPTAMADAVARLARLCWRIIWLTPLAADPEFQARTAGLVASRPYLDRLSDGSSIETICANVLDMASEKAA